MHFSNFLNFRPLNNSLELRIIFSWISLPKGVFWQNKKKFDFLWASFDSRYSQKMALKLFTLQLYEFAGFWTQCNSMFVIVSYSGIFWLVTHSSPINHQGGHVFHQIQNTVCLLKTTVHSVYMYMPENVLLYGEQEEGTDMSTFTDARFELLQTIILSRQKAHTFFLPLARFMC